MEQSVIKEIGCLEKTVEEEDKDFLAQMESLDKNCPGRQHREVDCIPLRKIDIGKKGIDLSPNIPYAYRDEILHNGVNMQKATPTGLDYHVTIYSQSDDFVSCSVIVTIQNPPQQYRVDCDFEGNFVNGHARLEGKSLGLYFSNAPDRFSCLEGCGNWNDFPVKDIKKIQRLYDGLIQAYNAAIQETNAEEILKREEKELLQEIPTRDPFGILI